MYDIGDKVVYPMHGAGIIETIEEQEILGESRKYYVMKMPLGDMKVMVPMKNVEELGVRQIVSADEVESVLNVLRDEPTKMPQNWNRRYRANLEKIKTGDIYEVAEVVRNLAIRDREKGLSTGERKMLDSAKQILVSELVLAQDSSQEDVEEMLQGLLE
jgi:CarD family transcriptional regulator